MTMLRVIKLGGSLLTCPQLGERLPAWLAQQRAATTVIVVGGGPLVDALRRLDAAKPIAEETAHWLAIDAMSLSARLIAEWFPGFRLVEHVQDVPRNCGKQPPYVLDVRELMRGQDLPGTKDVQRLPCTWDVTSDSIAAYAASVLQADELVLLKSAMPQDRGDFESLAAEGYVDAFFPRAAARIPVVCAVDLAGEPVRELRIGAS